MARGVAIASVVALLSCGGQPVGSKVPRADPKKMAVGAAAVAGAMTLADPKGAKQKAERPEPEKEQRVRKSGESVPADVLDRLEAPSGERDDCDEPTRTDQATPAGGTGAGVELVPKVENENRKKCREDDDEDDGDAADQPPASGASK